MPEAPDPALPPKPQKRWLPRPRFSLRTLVIAVLLVGSAGGLWWHWEPWVRTLIVSDQEKVASVALSPDGNLLAVGTGPKKGIRHPFNLVEIYNLRTNQLVFRKSTFPDSSSLSFSAGSKWLCMSGPRNSTAPNATMVMNSTTAEIVECGGDEDAILDLWPDDSKALLHHGDDEGRVVEIPSGKPVGALARPGRFSLGIMCWDISRDGRRIANFSVPDRPGLVLYDAADLRIIASMPEFKGAGRFTEDSKLFLFRLFETPRTLLLFDAEDGRQIAKYEGLDGFADSADKIALMRQKEGSNTDSYTATIQTIRDSKVLTTIDNAPLNLWFSDDGSRIIGYSSKRFVIWNISGGTPILDLSFKDIQMVVEGSRILSWSRLETAFDQLAIWDVHSGQRLCSLRGHERGIVEARLSRNGDRAMSWDESCASVWSRRRPEYWWGIAWLPEFWLTVLFAGALGWSVWRDRKQVRKQATGA